MGISEEDRTSLLSALLTPAPQIEAGKLLSKLPYEVACMDCSDGPANAIFQLASVNSMKLTIFDQPEWNLSQAAKNLLEVHKFPVENACYNFGDWQLACLIPQENRESFQNALTGFPLTWMGHAERGIAEVLTQAGLHLKQESLNENFRGGYNSIKSVEELIQRYMVAPVFDRSKDS
jgi:thiamine monophosphate kinase